MIDDAGVIFDVDGVLVDSYDAHWQSWQRVAGQLDEQITHQQFARTFGRTSRDIIQELWPHRSFSHDQVRILDDLKESIFRSLVQEPFPAMPGARELLHSLNTAGFRLAVGSSGPPDNVELVLRHIDPSGRVAVRVTGQDVTRGKPDPQVFLLAADRLQLDPPQCIVVEDAPAGIQAARAAGMRTVGLVSRGRTREELAAADRCVDSLQQLVPADFAQLLTLQDS